MDSKIPLLTFIFLTNVHCIVAQTAIHDATITGPATAPHSSAVLDVKSTDKGVLVPNVDIANLATAAPVTGPAVGLLVYNTNATTGEGYYYWNGTSWIRVMSGNTTPLTGAGTADYLARWTSAVNLSIGATRDNGTNVGFGVAPNASYRARVAGNMLVDGTGSTIGGSNLANAFLLVGTSAVGIGMDPNELYFRGADGNFGVLGANDLHINVNGSSRMSLLSTGVIRLNSYTTNGIVRTTAGNGTLTSGGAINLTSEVTGVLPVANGGIGVNTIPANGVMVGNGTSPITTIAPGTSGNVLVSNGTGWTSGNGSGSFIRNQTTVQAGANFFTQSAAVGSVGGIIRGIASQTADLQQWQNSAGTILARVANNGNLGIGTTAAPTQKLHVGGGGNLWMDGTGNGVIGLGHGIRTANRAELHLHSNGDTPSEIMFGRDARTDANTRWVISAREGAAGTSPLYIYEGPYNASTFQERVAFLPGGHVGVGTTAPRGNMHVANDFVLGSSNGTVRKYASSISATQGGLIKMGELTMTGASQNHLITGKVYVQSGGSSGETDFSIMIRTTTISNKTIRFWQVQTIAGFTVNLKVYDDAATGRIVVGFQPSATVQSFGWDLTLIERGNYDFWQNENGYVALDPTGLTEITAQGTNHMNLLPGGNVGIGQNNPTYNLHVNGRIGTNAISETSDARLKTDVTDLKDALTQVLAMRGVNYRWRRDEYSEMKLDSALQFGLIAQELEKVVPELVHTDSEGWKSIEYSHIVPLLIEAMKEQQSMIDSERNEKSVLKAEIEALRRDHGTRISILEAALKQMKQSNFDSRNEMKVSANQ